MTSVNTRNSNALTSCYSLRSIEGAFTLKVNEETKSMAIYDAVCGYGGNQCDRRL